MGDCDLGGWYAALVQVCLVVLIFIAVKSKRINLISSYSPDSNKQQSTTTKGPEEKCHYSFSTEQSSSYQIVWPTSSTYSSR